MRMRATFVQRHHTIPIRLPIITPECSRTRIKSKERFALAYNWRAATYRSQFNLANVRQKHILCDTKINARIKRRNQANSTSIDMLSEKKKWLRKKSKSETWAARASGSASQERRRRSCVMRSQRLVFATVGKSSKARSVPSTGSIQMLIGYSHSRLTSQTKRARRERCYYSSRCGFIGAHSSVLCRLRSMRVSSL